MMFFQDGEFPQCGKVYRAVIGSILPGSKVFDAMVACCDSHTLTKQALSPGTYPRLNIAKLTMNGPGCGTSAVPTMIAIRRV